MLSGLVLSLASYVLKILGDLKGVHPNPSNPSGCASVHNLTIRSILSNRTVTSSII